MSAARVIDPLTTSEVGKRLRATRQALDIHQAGIARIANISPQAWSNYEGGRRKPEMKEAVHLCELFALTLDWIFRGRIDTLPRELAKKIRAVAPELVAQGETPEMRLRRELVGVHTRRRRTA
jgi:transcriptional regulator with XRE-family HTH domain